MTTGRKGYTHNFLVEAQKLLERAPTNNDADLAPCVEGLSDISQYLGQFPDIAFYDGSPRSQGLTGVNEACVNKTNHMVPEEEVLAGEVRRACPCQFTGPPHPFHHPGYLVSNALRTSALKCAGASSWWNHIRVFMLAGTLCSRTGSTSCRYARYVPPSRRFGRRYGPIT
ncbi:uncharacterized protein TNCV_4843871 [Trichonephila clavipes]|uniref:Uncharacterized protein n=1 Tax=Trichonephila clavipes TaxID=2585209 RepID=A0A8X7BLW5_TRICX|nr:uncharacterized protein TNCV_4843871 [Trichonephila clavipes]